MTTAVELCGEWNSRSEVGATGNAGSNSVGGRCPSEDELSYACLNKGKILWQALHELFC
jgi:hypothetical protein